MRVYLSLVAQLGRHKLLELFDFLRHTWGVKIHVFVTIKDLVL